MPDHDFRTVFCVTYPRHGSHFLRENLTQEVDKFNIVFQHGFDVNDISEDSIILTVIRNPVDAITSKIISGLEINQSHDDNNDVFFAEERIEDNLSRVINSYIDTYHKLSTYKKLMVVDFSTFETNPWWAFNYIFKSLGSNKELNTFIMPESDENFIATSKNNPYYQYCYNEVKNHEGIDNCFDAYNLLATRLYENIDLN